MNPRHRVLIVGTGSIGERHLRCFLATERADVAFVEPNAALAHTIGERYPRAGQYSDLDSAVAGGVNAVVVATPAPSHIPIATRLVEAGIHTLIEKPLSTTLDGVTALNEL